MDPTMINYSSVLMIGGAKGDERKLYELYF